MLLSLLLDMGAAPKLSCIFLFLSNFSICFVPYDLLCSSFTFFVCELKNEQIKSNIVDDMGAGL